LTRVRGRFVGQSNARKKHLGSLYGLGLMFTSNANGGFNDIFQDRHVGKQVELLEHHAYVGSLVRDLPFTHFTKP